MGVMGDRTTYSLTTTKDRVNWSVVIPHTAGWTPDLRKLREKGGMRWRKVLPRDRTPVRSLVSEAVLK